MREALRRFFAPFHRAGMPALFKPAQKPEPEVPSGIEKMVCQDIAARQELGIRKYGTTVADNPLSLREWLEHAYQESLDQAIYLRRAMAEIDKRK